MIRIEHLDDPRVADYANLRDAELVKRRGIFVAEGTQVVRTLVESRRMNVRSVFLSDKRVDEMRGALASTDLVYVASPEVMSGVVGFDIHRGCLAAGDLPPPTDPRSLLPGEGPATVLVLEALANHDNVGAAFRNAAAFGVDAVWLDERCADPLYRKAIRTSMAATLTVPWARASLDDVRALASQGYEVVAMTPAGERSLAQLERLDRVALLVGTEGRGLSEAALATATRRVRIDMAEGHDSLNVATAAAVALYALRGR